MRTSSPGRRPVALLMTALLLLGAGRWSSAEPNPVRKRIKAIKKDLIAFERDVAELVERFHSLQDQLDSATERMRFARRTLKATTKTSGLRATVSSWLIEPIARVEMSSARSHKEVLEELIPEMRTHIWNKGLERDEFIEDLDDAISVLESARSGKLVTKAGVGRGQLITYSADWAAVSQCESSGRWHINTGLFDGGLQFLPSTWWGFGGGQYARYAYQATRRQQIDIAERVLAVQGPKAWPNCFTPLPVDTEE